MTFVEYPDVEMMMMDLADALASELKSALLTHDRVTFAVPGGTTPGPVFDTLSGVRLDWARVTIVPTDERWVPEDHARSNARLIRERLLTEACAAATLIPIYDAEATPEAAATALSARLAPSLPFDVVLLGMGTDMHTASLFPDAPGIAAALAPEAPAVMAMYPPGQPEARITLTGPALTGAMATHVVITGAEKRAAIERAAKLPAWEAPIHTVLTNATIHWAP